MQEERLTDQEVQETFDAIEQYHSEHPEVAKTMHKYEEAREALTNHATIVVRTSTGESSTISYSSSMTSHARLNDTTAWILQLYRYVRAQS